jgi:hypothetical protein
MVGECAGGPIGDTCRPPDQARPAVIWERRRQREQNMANRIRSLTPGSAMTEKVMMVVTSLSYPILTQIGEMFHNATNIMIFSSSFL